MSRPQRIWLIFAIASTSALFAGAPSASEQAQPNRFDVPAMKTSIYVGSVTLSTTAFQRSGTAWSATYDADVFPWAFWSEHGDISISVPDADVARLMAGETIEFTGDAKSHKGKPRSVTGRAQPSGAHDGRIKVRIHVDGIELVFNGDYSLVTPP